MIILRIAIAVILLAHSIPGMFNGGIQAFGELYLNKSGFAPIGVPLAWAIKLSHVLCAFLLIMNRYIKAACIITIFILVVGIAMVHYKDGWYVVGGGRNGVEFNFLMIAALITIMYPKQFNNAGA